MTLRRGAALAATIGVILLLIPAPAAASGGGGCGQPVTNETGTDVAIGDFCFTPTVLYADVGDTVTWTNVDLFPHSVAGANKAWGSYESFRKRHSVSYSFSESGVYSYVCTVLPGMVGTVVVGDPAPGGSIATNAVRRIKAVSAVQSEPVESRQASEGAALWLGAIAIIVAMGGALVGRKVVRRARP